MTGRDSTIEVRAEGTLLGRIVKASLPADGPTFVTDPSESLQVGVLVHPAGKTIPAHVHLPGDRVIRNIQEVLLVQSGRARVSFWTENGRKVAEHVVGPGDVVILVSGGHGFEFLEASRVVEVKQGPYRGVALDKKLL